MSRRRTMLLVLAALLAYAIALVATLPSAWIAHAVERQSEGRLEIRAPAGTAWAGGGRLFARLPAGTWVELGALRWTASPSSLLALRIRASITHGVAGTPMLVELSPWGLAVQRLRLELPGAAVAAFAPALATFEPEGTLHVRSDSLRMERNSFLGTADVEWRQVRLAGLQGAELGSHVARLQGTGGRVAIDVSTLDGPLVVRAKGSWDRTAGLAIAGTAEPRTPDLVPFLRGVCAGYRDAVCEFAYRPATRTMP